MERVRHKGTVSGTAKDTGVQQTMDMKWTVKFGGDPRDSKLRTNGHDRIYLQS